MLSTVAAGDRRRGSGIVNEKASKEARRIQHELGLIDTIVSHVQRDWDNFVRTGDEAYLKATAYDLHGFYTGLERIFVSVADTIDDHIPQGESWHKDLLDQMCGEIEGIRPALLTDITKEPLEEFMRFRHRIRNIYSFNLVPERLKILVEKLPGLYEQVNSDLQDFSQFLEELTG